VQKLFNEILKKKNKIRSIVTIALSRTPLSAQRVFHRARQRYVRSTRKSWFL